MARTHMEPDWTTAPEGATHYCSLYDNWLRQGLGFSEVYLRGKGWSDHGGQYPDNLEEGSHILKRPDAARNGQGLPLSGTDIEYLGHLGKWKKGKYLGEFNGQSVCGDYETGAIGYVEGIRPIRTPEQIAAEKREKAISQMLAIFDAGVESSLRQHARNGIEALYDAGHYKPTE